MWLWRTALLLTLWAFGCGGGAGAGDDGADTPSRDATIVDAGVTGAVGSDAAAIGDAGFGRDVDEFCAPGACDPRLGDCEGETACALTAEGPVCMAYGDVPEGEACLAAADCAPNLTCFRRGEGGVCAKPCCPGDGEAVCGKERSCNGIGVLVDGTETNWLVCVPQRSCDALQEGDACEPGEGCYIVTSSGGTDCRLAGHLDVGESCSEQSDCQSGLFCAGLSMRSCVRICSLNGTDPQCPVREGSCRAYSHSPPGTGLCTVESPSP